MSRLILPSAGCSRAPPLASSLASAQYLPSTPPMVVMVQAQPEMRGSLGGGFIEFLFGDNAPQRQAAPPPAIYPDAAQRASQPIYANTGPAVDPMLEPQGTAIDPQFLRQRVDYQGTEEPGTIVIDTPNHFLYLVEPGGKAMRYGIGVGRPGFTWSGMHTVSSRRNGRTGCRRRRCSSASPTCRISWPAVRTIRSARARSISARRSTASTARTSPGPSARTSRPAASACATSTSSTSMSRVKLGTKVVVL